MMKGEGSECTNEGISCIHALVIKYRYEYWNFFGGNGAEVGTC